MSKAKKTATRKLNKRQREFAVLRSERRRLAEADAVLAAAVARALAAIAANLDINDNGARHVLAKMLDQSTSGWVSAPSMPAAPSASTASVTLPKAASTAAVSAAPPTKSALRAGFNPNLWSPPVGDNIPASSGVLPGSGRDATGDSGPNDGPSDGGFDKNLWVPHE